MARPIRSESSDWMTRSAPPASVEGTHVEGGGDLVHASQRLRQGIGGGAGIAQQVGEVLALRVQAAGEFVDVLQDRGDAAGLCTLHHRLDLAGHAVEALRQRRDLLGGIAHLGQEIADAV